MAPKRQSSRPPIIDPYLVDYAPTSRAACKKCGGAIGEGKVRFGRKVWSPFHDGFDMQFHHFRCAFDYAKSLNDVRGWQALKWTDQIRLANKYGETLDEEKPEVVEYKRRNELLWELKNNLLSLNLKALRPILDANDQQYIEKKLKPPAACHIIADGLLFGRLPKCPLCECEALVQEGAEVRCTGWISHATKCTFRHIFVNLLTSCPKQEISDDEEEADEGKKRQSEEKDEGEKVDEEKLQRVGLFRLPEEAKRMPVFSKWKPPAEASGIKLFGNPMTASSIATTSFSSSGSCGTIVPKKGRKESEESEEEVESDVPMKQELIGIRFSSIGSTTPSRHELANLILKHGGEFSEDLSSKTTYLLVGDNVAAAKESKRFNDAVAMGLPVLHCDFVKALISRKIVRPKNGSLTCRQYLKEKREQEREGEMGKVMDPRPRGVILRRRKYAAFYKIAGDIVMSVGRAKEMMEKRMADEADNNAKEAERQIKRMRPSIKANSALLKVDKLFSRRKGKIYVDSYNNAYNCSVHSTNVATGVNKYYTLQIVCVDIEGGVKKEKEENNKNDINRGGHSDSSSSFNEDIKPEGCQSCKKKSTVHLFRKWGRVGAESALTNDYRQESFGYRLREAKEAFESKFRDLTGIVWDDRFDSKPQPGRYEFVELAGHAHEEGGGAKVKDDGEKAEEEGDDQTEEDERKMKKRKKMSFITEIKEHRKSILHPRIQELIKMIFDRTMMEQQLESQNLNLEKLPLASISKRQLREGYSVLQELQQLLQETVEQQTSQRHALMLCDATNRFYTKIPHSFTHAKTPPIIDSLAKLRSKIDMMEQLLDVSVANSLMDEALRGAADRNPLDAEYDKLKCNFEVVEKNENEWQMVCKMVRDTHAATHNTYTVDVEDIFRCQRLDEKDTFNRGLGNRVLLWHGSRLSNWVGILSQGLRIAPKEAPSTGYMFGKGLYFADMASKSANYCFASSADPRGLIILCEVSLGKPLLKLEADYKADKECVKRKCDSVWGVGLTHPNPKEDQFLISDGDDGKTEKLCVPTGKSVKNTEMVEKAKKEILERQKEDAAEKGEEVVIDSEKVEGIEPTLLYNEYIVYNNSQVRVKYVVRLKFAFETFEFD